jgi:peptidoglycan hydrolase-like protein with peptidoglycan-binding domain
MKPEAAAARSNYWKVALLHACLLLPIALVTATQIRAAELSSDAINSAEPSGKSLPVDKPTSIGIRLQVLLDRAHFSPGEIDGKLGENAKQALRAHA